MNLDKMSLLVAEDHAFQRRSLVRMLNELGVGSVAQAADGREALQLLGQPGLQPDVIICDLDMPEMDGMEFIRHVGESGSRASLILTSALDPAVIASAETMTRVYGVHVLGTIEKPITPGRLAEMILSHEGQPQTGRTVGDRPSYSVEDIGAGLRNGQFEPFFQPKVELATGRVFGVEALARWRHPTDGIVPPGGFVAQMERSGLVDALTWEMLERSLAAHRAWQAAGHDLAIAVNLSQSTLAHTGIADRIARAARAAGVPTRSLTLEITETAAMSDVAHGLENLTRLRMRGFGLSIDDFGTGYSSMQQLSRIPFTEIKLDRSFVSGAQAQERLQVMVETSVMLARKLGLKFVAEGVETREEWDLLKRLGCYAAQGYFVARPMDAASLGKWLQNWTAPADPDAQPAAS